MNIPIYDEWGIQVESLTIDDDLTHVDGRVSKGKNIWYKGVGVPYTGHHVENPGEDHYLVCGKCDVFYIGYKVIKDRFDGKTGIFQERFQPHFTDWIGACGEKELQIVENLWELNFDYSGIDVKEFHPIMDDQYYLVCDYPYGRAGYLDTGVPEHLYNLMEYMIREDWNFPWDKSSITDVLANGKVTDVADVFKSNDVDHKLGTIYSLLYSLGKADHGKYMIFCQRYNLVYQTDMAYVMNSLQLLARFGVNISSLLEHNGNDTYRNTVKNHLVLGKNCGYCGVGSCSPEADPNKSWGEYIREQYMLQVSTL